MARPTKTDVLQRVAALPTIRKVEIAHELLQDGSQRRDTIALAVLRLAVRELSAIAELRAALPNDLQELCDIDARSGENAAPTDHDAGARRTARTCQ